VEQEAEEDKTEAEAETMRATERRISGVDVRGFIASA
jgi:hypothetical protein